MNPIFKPMLKLPAWLDFWSKSLSGCWSCPSSEQHSCTCSRETI
uniref:Fatty acid amide hydrolase n=1 Tax=Rhizophora mucronata TaxID=61149 RepID=A0A2P2MGG6_RHIMU